MTKAICFNCGSIKLGSLTACENCNVEPESKHDLAVSIHLSDHLMSNEELTEISKAIKEGVKVKLSDETVEKWSKMFE
ncbi:MAG: hypothetical protein C0602_05845 [Denitrovibrio sp.]|nr:MAG: hypothetical protein C0602_05845 [Denitrovibrio sp.]